jgi:hypothetical protein
LVEDRGPLEAYRRIREAIEAHPWGNANEKVDPYSVKVLETTHRLAKGVRELAARHLGRAGNMWFRLQWVGDTVVTGMYIYPAPQPAGS